MGYSSWKGRLVATAPSSILTRTRSWSSEMDHQAYGLGTPPWKLSEIEPMEAVRRRS